MELLFVIVKSAKSCIFGEGLLKVRGKNGKKEEELKRTNDEIEEVEGEITRILLLVEGL